MSNIENKLSRVDLNLLISLSVLLQEKNVSRAAQRLYLSQSAMSRTLQRLREVFDDPLFHRSARGIIPTAKAIELGDKLPNLLSQLDDILTSSTFDPVTCDSAFTISVPTLMSHALILPFMMELNLQAPNICISEYSAKVSPEKSLLTGALDFAIHINKPSSDDYNSTHIGKITPTIYARKNHPATRFVKEKLNQCLNYGFAELILEDAIESNVEHPIKALFTKKGLERKVIIRSTQLSILIQMLLTKDLLLTATCLLSKSEDIDKILTPIYQFNNDSVDLYLISHRRTDNSAAHQWIKNLLLASFTLEQNK